MSESDVTIERLTLELENERAEVQRLRDRVEELYRQAEDFGHQMVTAVLSSVVVRPEVTRVVPGGIITHHARPGDIIEVSES